jgi:hypothetical protein
MPWSIINRSHQNNLRLNVKAATDCLTQPMAQHQSRSHTAYRLQRPQRRPADPAIHLPPVVGFKVRDSTHSNLLSMWCGHRTEPLSKSHFRSTKQSVCCWVNSAIFGDLDKENILKDVEPQRADERLRIGILPWRSRCRQHPQDSHLTNSLMNAAP